MGLEVVNLYEDGAFTSAYSKEGSLGNPIWKFPPWDFDGIEGQIRERKIFLKNDGATVIRSVSGVADLKLTPIDVAAEGKETLLKLAFTEVGLDSAIAGQPILLPDLSPNESLTFWVRASIAAESAAQDIRDLRLKLSGWSFPVTG